MVTVLKTVFAFFGERGFESHPLRGLGVGSLTVLCRVMEWIVADKLRPVPLD